MQSSPDYRFDLVTVVQADNGNYITYGGMRNEKEAGYCYVEPVATDPEYRRLGLGKATVRESMPRAAQHGAHTGYVWSDTPFYRAIGFTPLNTHHCWTRQF